MSMFSWHRIRLFLEQYTVNSIIFFEITCKNNKSKIPLCFENNSLSVWKYLFNPFHLTKQKSEHLKIYVDNKNSHMCHKAMICAALRHWKQNQLNRYFKYSAIFVCPLVHKSHHIISISRIELLLQLKGRISTILFLSTKCHKKY